MKSFLDKYTKKQILKSFCSLIGLWSILFVTLTIDESAVADTIPTSNQSLRTTDVSVLAKETDFSSLNEMEMTVYRSPSCGCCGAWIDRMEQQGFKIKDIKTDDIATVKEQYNLPAELTSCHTAIVGGYIIEGHVPADDIKRFLAEKPQSKGLTVPGMVVGTPGMEVNNEKQPFQVLSFSDRAEATVFREYQSY